MRLSNGILFIFIIFQQVNSSWQELLKAKIASGKAPKWMIKRIEGDLNIYKNLGIDRLKLQDYAKETENSAKITVKDGNFSVETYNVTMPYNAYHGRLNDDVLKLLYDLNSVNKIKDLDIVLYLGDYCNLCYRKPIFSLYGKAKKDNDQIMFPAINSIKSYLNIVNDLNIPSWRDRKNKCIWRGADTGGLYNLNNYKDYPRTKLVSLSMSYPELIDARFNQLVQCENIETRNTMIQLGYLGNTMHINEHLKYKYQIDIAGNPGWAMRLYWQLFSESLIFKIKDNYINFFSDILKPWIHFIPIKKDLSNLIASIKWAELNDDLAYKIAKNAKALSKKNLTYENILYYLYLLIENYMQILNK